MTDEQLEIYDKILNEMILIKCREEENENILDTSKYMDWLIKFLETTPMACTTTNYYRQDQMKKIDAIDFFNLRKLSYLNKALLQRFKEQDDKIKFKYKNKGLIMSSVPKMNLTFCYTSDEDINEYPELIIEEKTLTK